MLLMIKIMAKKIQLKLPNTTKICKCKKNFQMIKLSFLNFKEWMKVINHLTMRLVNLK